MTVKAVVFDLGGVIVELDFSNFYNSIITQSPLNKPQTPILLEFFRQSDIYHQGLMSDEEFFHLACDLLQVCEVEQQRFFNAFNSIISSYNPEIVDIIKKIRQNNRIKLLCLSNVNASHWDYLISKNWDFLQYFDEFILSHEVHLTKPDKKIFEFTIEKAGCNPDEIVFIDDGINNIRAAGELGIIAIKFSNEEDLIKELEKLKVL